MTLSDYFALKSGNQASLVRALGLPQTTVAHWASRSRSVPAEYCVSIEQATRGAVNRKDLLPNTWSAIWPELAAPVPPHACTAGTLATQLGARKLANLVERGHEVIGHILHKDGQYALFDGSCRWLTKPQYQRLMHEQDGSLFGPAAAPADDGAKLRAAIAKARFVYETVPEADLVIDYIEQLLMTGAAVPAQTGISPGVAESAPVLTSWTDGVGNPLALGPDPMLAAARQAAKHQSDFDQAAAAMAAESAKKVADAEWFASRCTSAAPAPIDAASTPTTIAHLVVEVDTTQLDAALAKAEQLKVLLAGLLPRSGN